MANQRSYAEMAAAMSSHAGPRPRSASSGGDGGADTLDWRRPGGGGPRAQDGRGASGGARAGAWTGYQSRRGSCEPAPSRARPDEPWPWGKTNGPHLRGTIVEKAIKARTELDELVRVYAVPFHPSDGTISGRRNGIEGHLWTNNYGKGDTNPPEYLGHVIRSAIITVNAIVEDFFIEAGVAAADNVLKLDLDKLPPPLYNVDQIAMNHFQQAESVSGLKNAGQCVYQAYMDRQEYFDKVKKEAREKFREELRTKLTSPTVGKFKDGLTKSAGLKAAEFTTLLNDVCSAMPPIDTEVYIPNGRVWKSWRPHDYKQLCVLSNFLYSVRCLYGHGQGKQHVDNLKKLKFDGISSSADKEKWVEDYLTKFATAAATHGYKDEKVSFLRLRLAADIAKRIIACMAEALHKSWTPPAELERE